MVEEGFLGDSRVGDDDREGTGVGAWCGAQFEVDSPCRDGDISPEKESGAR